MAKIIHIIYYILMITAAFAGPSLVIGTLKYGAVFFLIFLPELILISCFVVFFTSVLYTCILVFFDGEKLKDIINYFQIALSVAITVFYQLIGQIFDISETVINVTPAWWHYFLPSAWFAAPFSLFLEQDVSLYYIHLCTAALAVPTISLILYISIVRPRFELYLQKLNSSSTGKTKTVSFRKRLHDQMADFICADRQERAFCKFTQKVAGNERKLKLVLYPSLAFAVVMPFIFMFGIFGDGKNITGILRNISSGRYHLGLYYTAVILANTVLSFRTSQNYSGAWIYRALPLETPVPIFRGAVKSILLNFMIPAYIIPAVIFVLLMGPKVIPDIALIFFNMLVLTMFIFKLSKKELPFYRDFHYTQDGNTVAAVFISLFAAGLMAGVHFLISGIPFGVPANTAVSIIVFILLWKSSFRIAWKDVSL